MQTLKNLDLVADDEVLEDADNFKLEKDYKEDDEYCTVQ